ncbi:hypothetical protein CAC42_3182 [Sphaceloma murrayae]|uniref:ZW10 C-terminal helical domain-containing protein n=1 Tax=Sphaceloma murrayae TaxID=2082308 RepID=A0A2K1QRS3_9PEZI|nr:hypothetical protein CAC42_3182 [Sphaceloma murrayae]
MTDDEPSKDIINPLVNSIKSATYPDVDIAGEELTPDVFAQLHHALNHAKKDVEVQVRSLSKDVAPDVDGWIARATQVQQDIQQSKATARSIVEEAEAQASLKKAATESAQKVDLLEKELAFSTALEDALVYIQSVATRLSEAKEHVVGSRINRAFDILASSQEDLDKLQASYSTNASRALASRASSIRDSIVQSSEAHIRNCISISPGKQVVDISRKQERCGDADLEACANILRDVGKLDPLIQSMQRDLERSFFELWSAKPEQKIARLQTTSERAWLDAEQEAQDVTDILADVGKLVGFLDSALPRSLKGPIAETLLPDFWSRLEQNRLNASVPINITDLGTFDNTLTAVSRLSRTLSTNGWSGHDQVQGWIENAPRVWLARQREHTLEAVRRALLSNLKKTKQVEKVETQVVENDEIIADVEDWDTEWKADPQPPRKPGKQESVADDDDDDGSAWDDQGDAVVAKANGKEAVADEDEAAWGWDDAQVGSPAQTKLSAPLSPTKANKIGNGTEVTLRETYTVTEVPETIYDECVEVYSKARRLSGGQFSSSAIAPGIAGLSNVPTLATALYRAMALTAYDKVESGKILLYNDSMRIADLLKSLVDGKTETSLDLTTSAKRKLEHDVAAFERFARVAYSTEMESQKTVLRDLLDGAQGFSNCTTSPYDAECDDAVFMTVDRVRDVYRQWTSTLSKSALLQSIGSLLSAVTSKFIVDIQELSDIGEEESKKLLGYCKSVSSLSDIFLEQHTGTKEVRDMTPLYCQNWLKFQYLGEILDGSLADIKYLWAEGELSLEFTTEEVVDFIEALFADSEHRRKAISEIKASGR